jgi:hypothetical protein
MNLITTKKWLLGIAVSMLITASYSQNFQWASHIGGSRWVEIHSYEHERILNMAVDDYDNTYALCYFRHGMYDKIWIDHQSINSVSVTIDSLPVDSFLFFQTCLLLVSYDCSGQLRWYKIFRATEYVLEIPMGEAKMDNGCMDIVNNKIVVSVNASFNAWNTTKLHITDQNSDTVFKVVETGSGHVSDIDGIMQFDTEGQLEWIHTTHVAFPEEGFISYRFLPEHLTHDDEGNIHLLGWVLTMRRSSVTGLLVDTLELYVRKYSSTGELLASAPINIPMFRNDSHFFCKNNSYYFIISTINPNIVIYNDTIPAPVNDEIEERVVLVKIDQFGQLQYYRYLSPDVGIPHFGVSKAKMDSHNNIYMAGRAAPSGLTQADGCFVKIDSLGNILLVKLNLGVSSFSDVDILSDTLVVITGAIRQERTLEFDDINLNVEGKGGIFIALLNQITNKFVYATRTVGNGAAIYNVSDSRNNIIVGGQYQANNFTIGDSIFNNHGGLDIYVARYGWNCNEQAQWPTSTIGIAKPAASTATSDNRLLLYPNPTTKKLRIMNYDLRKEDKVEIYNMLGQKQFSVFSFQLSTIDVLHLPAGMYIVRVGKMVGKFVKE